jgi:ribosomal protein L11 methyltransferase
VSELQRWPTVHVDVSVGEAEEAAALLWSLGAIGLEERDATTIERPDHAGVLLIAHFDDEDRARIAAAALPWAARVEHIVGEAWRDRWKAFFKPTRIGERLVVRPSWEPVEARTGDVVLTLDPGHAFGTGTHESTRLVLAELEQRIEGRERVLDVGCGSGILAIAAVLLGAESAVAIDVDPDAIAATKENAEKNGVSDRIRTSTTPLSRVRKRFDVVVANIESRVLIPMARSLIARLSPGGLLVLSGLLATEKEELLQAYHSVHFVGERLEGDWVALTFRAPNRRDTKWKPSPRKPPASSEKEEPAPSPPSTRSKRSTTRAFPRKARDMRR